MELNPKPEVVKQLKKLAQKKGISLNALLVPYLVEIAEGRLVMHAGPPPAAQVVNKAA